MPIFYVEGYESTKIMVYVEADTAEDAIEKAWDGDVIEGTQDTEPGENIWKRKWKARAGEERVNESGFGRGRKSYGLKA